jgi:hypothetical protein
MSVVRIRRKLESETLHLPELKPLLGKTVEIIVQEETAGQAGPGTGAWDAALQAVRELEDYDFAAQREQREYDLRHADGHLP